LLITAPDFTETGPPAAPAADAGPVALERLLTRQAGVVTLAQAVAAGMTARTVQRRVRAGAWRQLHPRVYLVGGHRLTDEARVRAAWLWAGGRPAAVTGVAAAHWHGMVERAPARIEVTLPVGTHRAVRRGIVQRRRDLRAADLVEERGLWLAAKPLAALEAAVALPDGSALLDRALQQHVRFPAVYRSYCRNLGRRGSTAAGRLLTAAADHADSAAERLLVKLLREAGISGWVLGHPFGPYRIDLAFPAVKVAVEVDGWAWHVDPERFRQDRRKGNFITRNAWDLLRFTWHALDGEPAESIAEIRETLQLAQAHSA
jgi:very-short-patch-repair endonuclease